jgi:hypothetical protein
MPLVRQWLRRSTVHIHRDDWLDSLQLEPAHRGADRVPDELPDGVPDGVPERVPYRVAQRQPIDEPERVPERVAERADPGPNGVPDLRNRLVCCGIRKMR